MNQRKPTIRKNIYGNWNAFIGTSKVKEFGTDEMGARIWLGELMASIGPAAPKRPRGRPRKVQPAAEVVA